MAARQTQKAQQIYESLRRAIVLLEMAPGSPIAEKDICAAYGVSRTPVREAVLKLAEEGLANVIPHSGTYVSRISFQVANEGFVIRRALEIESVRRAAERVDAAGADALDEIVGRMAEIVARGALDTYIEADDALHGTLARMSGLGRLWKFIQLAKVDLDRMRQLSAPVPGHLARVTQQHAQIVEAVKRGRPDEAELAMRIHLESSFEVMAGLVSGGQGVFLEDVGGTPAVARR